MPTNQVNIVVDVKRVLDPQAADALVSELGGLQGVSGARMSARTQRLVLVDFDPKQTSTQRVLGTVQRRGIDARLIGM